MLFDLSPIVPHRPCHFSCRVVNFERSITALSIEMPGIDGHAFGFEFCQKRPTSQSQSPDTILM
jgi:hypothetical protein